MTHLWWVRHGPTHEKAFVGWRDVPADLSDHAAISRLEAALPQDALVVSSDLARAVTTADAIAGHRVRLPHDRALREFNFGAWDGRHFSQVAETDPALSRAFWECPGDIAPPQGESWNGVATRVSTAVDGLCRRHPDQHLILVAHIGVILTQVARALDCTPFQALGHKIDNLSVTDMRLNQGGWYIGRINHIP